MARLYIAPLPLRLLCWVLLRSTQPTNVTFWITAMKDTECVRLLQWALPQLNLRWAGFRKVRKQACKRIQRRIVELGLSDIDAYQSYLNTHPEEWTILDCYCRITISRFYRDQQIFQQLHQELFPQLIQLAQERGDTEFVCWSAGCASGEEAYTLSILWHLAKFAQVSHLSLRIIATDTNAYLLERARTGCYQGGTLKELPSDWLAQAFTKSDNFYCIRPEFREEIEFKQQDIRSTMPSESFHLILCRNLVLTYFDTDLQQKALSQIVKRLIPGGVLVVGSHEALPSNFRQMPAVQLGLYRKEG